MAAHASYGCLNRPNLAAPDRLLRVHGCHTNLQAVSVPHLLTEPPLNDLLTKQGNLNVSMGP